MLAERMPLLRSSDVTSSSANYLRAGSAIAYDSSAAAHEFGDNVNYRISQEMVDRIDSWAGPITDVFNGPMTSEEKAKISAFLNTRTLPSAPDRYYVPLPAQVTPAEMLRAFQRSGLKVYVGSKSHWPKGVDLHSNGEIRAYYFLDPQDEDRPCMLIRLPENDPVQTKLSVMAVLSRHGQLMAEPAEKEIILAIDNPVSASAIGHSLSQAGWSKSLFRQEYSHPKVSTLATVKVPRNPDLTHLTLSFSKHATRDDELHYRQELSAMVKKLARP